MVKKTGTKKKQKSETLRKTGIDIIGDVPWGTHFCQFYQTKKDLIDILVPYFKAGLENNEFCMWITSEPLKVKDSKAALKKVVKNLDNFIKKGQIEILDYSEWYTKSGKFDANNVLQGWVEKENQAFKKGYDGLRLSGNTFWLEKKDWKHFTDYEEQINNVIGKYRMIAICTYFLGKCGASEVTDVVSNHQFALIRREGKWVIIESSERKQAEEALRDSKERYRLLFNGITDAVYVHEVSVRKPGKFIAVNDSACRMLGYTMDEFLQMEVKDIDIPEISEKISSIHEKLFRDGCALFETCHVAKDGRRIPVEINIQLFELQGSSMVLAVARDMTERKQAEENIRDLAKFPTENPYPVLRIDRNGRLLYVNIAGERLFSEWSLQTGQTVPPVLQKAVSEAIEKGSVQELELELNDQTYSFYVTPIADSGYSNIYCLDITKHIRAEEALKKAHADILMRQDAILNLSEDLMTEIEKRKKTQEKIEQYHARLRNLVSQMALIEENERRRIANVLHDAVGQNLALSKILLDELQAADPSVPFSLSLGELTKIIDEAINSTRNLTFEISSPVLYELGIEAAIEWLGEKLLRRRNILFDFRNDRTPKPLTKEAQVLLFQAVREFYLNIIKHSKAHHVRVFIQELGSNIHISIEDDGIGFDTKTLHSQVSESLTYGLFSVRERISLIGGSFEIESTTGQGTRVTLIAPLAA